MRRKTCVTSLMVLFLACATFMAAAPASGGKGSRVATLEMMTTPDTPAGFEDAAGRIRFNTTGATLKFALKASGLEPGEDYIVVFCSVIIGAGTSSEKGRLLIRGSGNGPWQIDSIPEDPFELYRVSDLAIFPRFWDLELILRSPPSGYDWTK